MNKKLTTLFFSLLCGITTYATEFAPIGSKWVRCSKFYSFLNQDIFESKEEIDLEGKKAKRIEHTTITYSVDPTDNEKVKADTLKSDVYAYNVGDSVYYRHDNKFVLLFVYNQKVGDTLNLQWVAGTPGETYKAVIKRVDIQENNSKRYTVTYSTPNDTRSPLGDAVFEDGFGVIGYELNGKNYDCPYDYPVYAQSTTLNELQLVYLQNGNGIEVLNDTYYKQLAGTNAIKNDGNAVYYDPKTGELVFNTNYNKVELISPKGELVKSFTTGRINLNDIRHRILVAKIYLTNGSVVIKKIVR